MHYVSSESGTFFIKSPFNIPLKVRLISANLICMQMRFFLNRYAIIHDVIMIILPLKISRKNNLII